MTVLVLVVLGDDGDVILPSFLHVRLKKELKAVVEEEGDKTVSLMVGFGLRTPCLNLYKIVVVVVVVGDVGIGNEIGEDEILGVLVLLLHVLNLETDFDDDEDSSCEDPESDP